MATFDCTVSGITETTAEMVATFRGGDPNFEDYRVVKVELSPAPPNVPYFVFQSFDWGGADSDFSGTLYDLYPGTRYTWTATLGYIDLGTIYYTSYTDSGSFTTDMSVPQVSPWSWSASNGAADLTETRNAYYVLTGALSADNFSHKVWNDIVDKASEVLSSRGLSWDSTYETLASTKVSAGYSLSAKMFNSVKHNIDRVANTGVSYVSTGDRIYGSYITALTDGINNAIG